MRQSSPSKNLDCGTLPIHVAARRGAFSRGTASAPTRRCPGAYWLRERRHVASGCVAPAASGRYGGQCSGLSNRRWHVWRAVGAGVHDTGGPAPAHDHARNGVKSVLPAGRGHDATAVRGAVRGAVSTVFVASAEDGAYAAHDTRRSPTTCSGQTSMIRASSAKCADRVARVPRFRPTFTRSRDSARRRLARADRHARDSDAGRVAADGQQHARHCRQPPQARITQCRRLVARSPLTALHEPQRQFGLHERSTSMAVGSINEDARHNAFPHHRAAIRSRRDVRN